MSALFTTFEASARDRLAACSGNLYCSASAITGW